MAVKLFILGLPGSGKSAIARYIQAYVQYKDEFNPNHRRLTSRYNDYPILYTMYKDDNKHKRFVPAEPSGFNVIDFGTFDEALKSLGQWITQLILSKKIQPEEIVLIEFARNDYEVAFRQFDKDFLQNAYFIYLGANLEKCKQRIRDRVANPEFEDDYPVSDDIFERYYHSDDGWSLSQMLAQEFGIDSRRVLAFDNNCSLEEAKKKIAPFIDSIIDPNTTQKEEEDAPADTSTKVTPEEAPESHPATSEVTADYKDYQVAVYPTPIGIGKV